MLRASAAGEAAGIASSTLVCEGFLGLAAATSIGLGMPNLPVARVIGHPGVQSKEELRRNTLEVTLDRVVCCYRDWEALVGRSVTDPQLVFRGSGNSFLTGPGVIAIFDAPWVPLFIAIIFVFHPLLGVMNYFLTVVGLPPWSWTYASGTVIPALVIVDTLHRFAAVTDASASEQWTPVLTALDNLARTTNAAVLLTAQATKASGEYRDSTAIGHAVDVVLNLVRPDTDSPVRHLDPQKHRWPLARVTAQLVGDRLGQEGRLGRIPERRFGQGLRSVKVRVCPAMPKPSPSSLFP